MSCNLAEGVKYWASKPSCMQIYSLFTKQQHFLTNFYRGRAINAGKTQHCRGV